MITESLWKDYTANIVTDVSQKLLYFTLKEILIGDWKVY